MVLKYIKKIWFHPALIPSGAQKADIAIRRFHSYKQFVSYLNAFTLFVVEDEN
jgi:hypothetical protein